MENGLQQQHRIDDLPAIIHKIHPKHQNLPRAQKQRPKFPSFMKDQNAKDLIINLLAKKPNERGRFNFDKIK